MGMASINPNEKQEKPSNYCGADVIKRLRASVALAPLLAQPQWVLWKRELTDKGKWTKVPYMAGNPNSHAKNNDPNTWDFFDTAAASVHLASGVGFMLSEGNICAFDLDKCRDPITGALANWAQQLLDECKSYAEVTPSGTGLRIIGYGRGDYVHDNIKLKEKLEGLDEAGHLEIYRKCARYITVSGDVLPGYDLELVNIDAAIDCYKRAEKAQGAPKGNGDAGAAPKANGSRRPCPAAILEAIQSDANDGKRSDRLFEVTRELKRLAWTTDEIEALFHEHPGAILRKYGKRLRAEIDRAFEKIEANECTTDLGNARRLVNRYGNDIRYVHPFKSWFIWDGNFWRRDDNGEIMRLAAATVEAIWDEARAIADVDDQKKMRMHAFKSQERRRIDNMVALARNSIIVSLPPDRLDADPMLLGVLNGVIELSTGTFRDGKREDYITKRCNVAFDPAAKCPNWDTFHERIATGNDASAKAELIAYKRRMYGLALTGLMVETLFIMHGEGSNGKTTEAETIHAVLGDYACAADASLLISAHESGGATPEVVALKGRRAVFINETNESDHLNEARVKYVTSSATMSGRDLFEKKINFAPTHKPFLQTNHKPRIRGTDKGIWRRINYVPYLVTIADEEKQEHYRQEKLIPELTGILNWMLAGLKDYLENGLKSPRIISQATDKYRKEMDTVGQWIYFAIEKDTAAGAKLALTELYLDYQIWMENEMGWKPVSTKKLADKLRERGHESTLTKGVTYFKGVKLAIERPIGVGCAPKTYQPLRRSTRRVEE
jgi:putative DNA primase/helicase